MTRLLRCLLAFAHTQLHRPDALLRRFLRRVRRTGKAHLAQGILHLLCNLVKAEHPQAGLLLGGENGLDFQRRKRTVRFPQPCLQLFSGVEPGNRPGKAAGPPRRHRRHRDVQLSPRLERVHLGAQPDDFLGSVMDLLFQGCDIIALFQHTVRLFHLLSKSLCGKLSAPSQGVEPGCFGRRVARHDLLGVHRQIQVFFKDRNCRLRIDAHKLPVRTVADFHNAPALQPLHDLLAIAEQSGDLNALHFTFRHQSVSLLWGIAESYSGSPFWMRPSASRVRCRAKRRPA